MTETLHCKCGGEVRIVRLNDRMLGLGHVKQPRPSHPVKLPHHMHPVRLERASAAEVEVVPPHRAPSAALGARRSAAGGGS